MSGKNKVINALSVLPITRIATYIAFGRDKSVIKGERELNETTKRYFINKKIIESISNKFGIKPFFVVQPIPLYKYNLSNHLVFNGHPYVLDIEMNSKIGYLILREQYDDLSLYDKKNVIWLADMQENRNENLYVDSVHYNPGFSDEIAEEIAKNIKNPIFFNQNARK